MTDATSTCATPPCKICNTPSPFFDNCDFHKNAKIHRGYYDVPLQPANLNLDYHRCPSCGFMFTTFMDKWLPGDFATYVYNKDYPRFDGSYNGGRAGAAANIFFLAFYEHLNNLEFLDYGGGIGIQSALLGSYGAKRSLTYDPFAANTTRPEGSFHMVSCLEVLEHSIDPKKTVADLVSFMDKDSSLLFICTECQPDDILQRKTDWWYVTPRVGHVSFYTKEALRILFEPYGLQSTHIEHHTHILFKEWPAWAAQFMPAQFLPQ